MLHSITAREKGQGSLPCLCRAVAGLGALNHRQVDSTATKVAY
jgi:hypothetical protein